MFCLSNFEALFFFMCAFDCFWKNGNRENILEKSHWHFWFLEQDASFFGFVDQGDRVSRWTKEKL